MKNRDFLSLMKFFIIGILILGMSLGAVAFLPQYAFYLTQDIACCQDGGIVNGLLFGVVALVAIIGVAVGIGMAKSWVFYRGTKRSRRLF